MSGLLICSSALTLSGLRIQSSSRVLLTPTPTPMTGGGEAIMRSLSHSSPGRKQSCLQRGSEIWISYFLRKGCLKQGSPFPGHKDRERKGSLRHPRPAVLGRARTDTRGSVPEYRKRAGESLTGEIKLLKHAQGSVFNLSSFLYLMIIMMVYKHHLSHHSPFHTGNSGVFQYHWRSLAYIYSKTVSQISATNCK